MLYRIIEYVEDVTKTDSFLEMLHSTQALYFHLLKAADDNGLIDNAKAIMRACQCKEEDLNKLVKEEFIEEWQAEG